MLKIVGYNDLESMVCYIDANDGEVDEVRTEGISHKLMYSVCALCILFFQVSRLDGTTALFVQGNDLMSSAHSAMSGLVPNQSIHPKWDKSGTF